MPSHREAPRHSPLAQGFYERPVLDVAHDLIGCVVRSGDTSGLIVETEAYHESEPACHAFNGPTPRSEVLFAAPGTAYVYRSYGIHDLLNAVCEREGVGAAVLIRAIEPLEGITLMSERRGTDHAAAIGSGPGKLTQALGIGIAANRTNLLSGPVTIEPAPSGAAQLDVVKGERIGITLATNLPWRFCARDSPCVSRPFPPGHANARQQRAALSGPNRVER